MSLSKKIAMWVFAWNKARGLSASLPQASQKNDIHQLKSESKTCL